MDIEYLQSLHGDTSQNAGHDDAYGPDAGVGHKDIEADKHSRHEHIGQEGYEQAYERAQQQQVRHGVGHGGHEYRDTRREDDDDGKEEEHGQVVGKGPEDASGLLDLPYLVEGILDVAHQHEYRVEHEYQSDAQENTALRVAQVTVDEADDDVSCLGLRLEGISKPHLNILVVTETTRYGKDDGQYGHDGQQRAVGQGCSLLHDALGGKETDGQQQFLDHLQ